MTKLTKIALPIQKQLFKQENSFTESLSLRSQKELILRRFPLLTKALINKFNHDEIYSSQESQIAAQIIVSNATKRTKI